MRKPSPPISMLLIVIVVGALTWPAGAAIEHDRANQALIAAVKRRDTAAAIAALDAGADPNTRDDGGFIQARWGHLREWLRRLREDDWVPYAGEEQTVLLLALQAGPDGYPLFKDALPENTPLVVALLSRGTDANAPGMNGELALEYASSYGYIGAVRLLLDHGANVNSNSGATPGIPLAAAASSGRGRIVELLLTRGADVNLKDNAGWTPLMYAAERNNTAIVRQLLRKGAEVNARQVVGRTALMWAAMSGQADAATILLRAGADINLKDDNGATALRLANTEASRMSVPGRRACISVAELLKKAGAR